MAKSTKFSTSWNKSIQPRKQRKYTYNAPLHVKQNLMHLHLSKSLREKHGMRSLQVRVGDKVQVMRGSFSKKEGTVEKVELKNGKLFVTGIDVAKRDATKSLLSLSPSNLMITVLGKSDKKRFPSVTKKAEVKTTTVKVAEKVAEKVTEKVTQKVEIKNIGDSK